jgi:glycosyltransferase involved in cell wall biosynthesis
MEKISVVIIAQDEEERIANAVRSCLPFADEVLVVDGGSLDRTREVAERVGARVVVNPWPGYAQQRQYGASLAKHGWVFKVDADEEVDHDLALLLLRWKEDPRDPRDAFAVWVIGDFWGVWLDTSKPRHLRLHNRDVYSYVDDPVHEGIPVDGARISHIDGIIWHRGFRSVADHTCRFNRYTSLEAQKAVQNGRTFSGGRLMIRPVARFAQKYIVQRLFRRGMAGLAVALLWMMYEILVELKVYELCRQLESADEVSTTDGSYQGKASTGSV